MTAVSTEENPESRFTVLLSAEQCADSDDEEWIRPATEKEIGLVEERYPGMVFDDLAIDESGRPYSWRTIDGSRCPNKVLAKVGRNIRVFRW